MADGHRSSESAVWFRHWLLVLVSPLILGVLASLFVSWGTGSSVPVWLRWFSAILGVSWILLYLASFTRVFHSPILWLTAWNRSRRFKRPRVLVLDGSLVSRQPSNIPLYSTNKRPDDWYQSLSSRNPSWIVETGPLQSIETEHLEIIVNPFGEVYPEEDLSLHKTLTKIADWVYNGGVYVNVAGYPFWWQHNPLTGVTTESGRWDLKVKSSTQQVSGQLKPLLSDTLLGISPDMDFQKSVVKGAQEDSDRRRFGEIAGAGGPNDVYVFRPYTVSTPLMIPMLRSDDGKIIIIGAVPYGDGFFLFAGLEIDQSTPAFDKVVAAIEGWAKYETKRRRT